MTVLVPAVPSVTVTVKELVASVTVVVAVVVLVGPVTVVELTDEVCTPQSTRLWPCSV